MPIYEYRLKKNATEPGCEKCKERFEVVQKMSDAHLTECPVCKAPVEKLISSFSFNEAFNDKMKRSGLHKLVKKDKGVYEKQY